MHTQGLVGIKIDSTQKVLDEHGILRELPLE